MMFPEGLKCTSRGGFKSLPEGSIAWIFFIPEE
jgi:hypothetical protein